MVKEQEKNKEKNEKKAYGVDLIARTVRKALKKEDSLNESSSVANLESLNFYDIHDEEK